MEYFESGCISVENRRITVTSWYESENRLWRASAPAYRLLPGGTAAGADREQAVESVQLWLRAAIADEGTPVRRLNRNERWEDAFSWILTTLIVLGLATVFAVLAKQR